MGFYLQQVSIENDFNVIVPYIIIFRRNVINTDRTEHSNSSKTFVNDCICSNLCISPLLYPFNKHFSRNKGVLRHGADSFIAFSAEIPNQRHIRSIIRHSKSNTVFILKSCSYYKI